MTAIATKGADSITYTDATATAAATWYYQACAANAAIENCGPVVMLVVP